MPAALAIAAHPDDIEFLMGGTLLLLRAAGWETHYFNVATGNLGSMRMSPALTAKTRLGEARSAAALLGATWYPPICDDLGIFYDERTLRKVAAVVRMAAPRIVLTHSPQDYMEDHTNVCRLAVTAAFSREFPNYRTDPQRPPVAGAVTIYHAQPHGNTDALRQPIAPEFFVDTRGVQAKKRAALACHASQKEWLDATQGMDSYLDAMETVSREIGRLSGRFEVAEGWRRHAHLGFCGANDDPLRDALGSLVAGAQSPEASRA